MRETCKREHIIKLWLQNGKGATLALNLIMTTLAVTVVQTDSNIENR